MITNAQKKELIIGISDYTDPRLGGLKMYVSHHRQLDTEIVRIGASDNDVQLLMTIPGINCFTAVAIKSRIYEHLTAAFVCACMIDSINLSS